MESLNDYLDQFIIEPEEHAPRDDFWLTMDYKFNPEDWPELEEKCEDV